MCVYLLGLHKSCCVCNCTFGSAIHFMNFMKLISCIKIFILEIKQKHTGPCPNHNHKSKVKPGKLSETWSFNRELRPVPKEGQVSLLYLTTPLNMSNKSSLVSQAAVV